MAEKKKNWFAVHRPFLDSPMWLAEKFTKGQAWIDLIGMAAHEPDHFFARGVRVEVERGQLGRSEITLAKRWGWSRGKVRRFLRELESKTEQKIVQQKTNVTSLITILNYDKYQFRGTADGTASSTASGTPNGTQTIREQDNKLTIKSPDGDLLSVAPDNGSSPRKNCPHDEIVALYHKVLPELKPVRDWNRSAKAQLRARWNQDKKYQSLEWWTWFFGYVKESDFLMGKVKDFQANLLWLVGAQNFTKVLNGQYENRGPNTGSKRTDKNIVTAQQWAKGGSNAGN